MLIASQAGIVASDGKVNLVTMIQITLKLFKTCFSN